MAEVSLRHIKKVYPNMEKKKKGESEKKTNLKVTEAFLLYRILTWRSGTRSSSYW